MTSHLWSLTDPAPVVLIALRALVAGGEEAGVRRLLSGQFGKAHLRIFVLMQWMLARLADSAVRPILLAPPCAQGLTADEEELIDALAAAAWGDTNGAAARIASLTAAAFTPPALEAASALAEALRDAGCALSPRRPAGSTLH